MPPLQTRAVVDIGSNSLLLLVMQGETGSWSTVFEAVRVTGLGTDTVRTGLLTPSAVERTLSALTEFYGQARLHGAGSIVAAATMAARIAKNTADVAARGAATGTPFSVISGDLEAELGFRAVADDPAFGQSRRISIIDPGGNSTELVTAERGTSGWKILFRQSFPFGALGLRDTLLAQEAPDAGQILHAAASIDKSLMVAERPEEAGMAVVLGASGTNLVSIREKYSDWCPGLIHGAILTSEEVSRSVGWLCRMTDSERAEVVGLEPGRERTIHIGSLILERCMHALHVDEVSVSVRGWRHALLADDGLYAQLAVPL